MNGEAEPRVSLFVPEVRHDRQKTDGGAREDASPCPVPARRHPTLTPAACPCCPSPLCLGPPLIRVACVLPPARHAHASA